MILIIDDDIYTREALSETLDYLNIRYRCVDGIQTALEALKDRMPKIVIVDLILKDGCPSKVIYVCQNHTQAIKIVLMSAMPRPIVEKRAKELQVDEVLFKPFSLEDFEKTLIWQ